MYLRKLELKDAPLMLAWMHDKGVTEKLRTDFSTKTLQDAEEFIRHSWVDKDNVNLAIASDEDDYMGTVSLKHIEDGNAEFAKSLEYLGDPHYQLAMPVCSSLVMGVCGYLVQGR